jgi:hypothetical protein
MMYLNLWEANKSAWPKDPDEQEKIIGPIREKVKENIDKGKIKMWGMSLSADHGFNVSEMDPKEILGMAMFNSPYFKSKIIPMLSFDEAMDVMKAMQ